MEMIQNPEWIDPGRFGDLTLLPVHPPEIDSFILERVMHGLEVCIEECAVGGVEYHRL